MECEILDTDEPLTSESDHSLTSNPTVAQFLNVQSKQNDPIQMCMSLLDKKGFIRETVQICCARITVNT